MLDLLLPLVSLFAQAQSAEEESSNFLVSPNVGLMIWTLLAFLVAMFVLRKFAWPAITEALDKRQRAIEESIEVAENTRRSPLSFSAPANCPSCSRTRSSLPCSLATSKRARA